MLHLSESFLSTKKVEGSILENEESVITVCLSELPLIFPLLRYQTGGQIQVLRHVNATEKTKIGSRAYFDIETVFLQLREVQWICSCYPTTFLCFSRICYKVLLRRIHRPSL